jgi:HEAT repeat protein
MERVFAGVPHVYGFGSVAPAGPTAAIALERYLDRIGSYATHLERTSSEAEPAPNRALARALGHTTFEEFAGMGSDGETAARRELVCSLYDDTRPAVDRLGVVETMAADPAFLTYVPSIERFFDTHPRWSLQGPRAEASLGRLDGMLRPRGELLERLDALGAPTLRSELAGVAASLGWIDEARYRRIVREAVVELLDRDMGLEEQNAICALAPELGEADLHEDELDPEIFEDPTGGRGAARYAARALLCVEPREPALRGRLALALDDESWGVRARALETLARLGVDEPDVWAAAARMLAHDPRTEVRAEAARTLAERRPIGAAALSGALRDPEPAVRAVAARGLGGFGDHPGVASRLARALEDGDWQVQFAAASALERIAQSTAGFEGAGVSAEVERALERALDATSWFVRYKVAEALARIRTAAAEVAGAEAGHSEG